MARATLRNEFRFLISARVPRASAAPRPHGDVGVAAQRALLHVAVGDPGVERARPSARSGTRGPPPALRRSGWETISIRGTPLRLKSTPLFSADQGKPSCSSLPASSSMWMRCSRTRRSAPPAGISRWPLGGQRPLVLRDLVALGQVRVEVVLAGEDRRLAARCSAWPGPRAGPGSPPARSARAARRAGPGRPGRRWCWARRRSGCGRSRRSWCAVRSWTWTSSPITGSYARDDPRGRGARGGHGGAILPLPLTAAVRAPSSWNMRTARRPRRPRSRSRSSRPPCSSAPAAAPRARSASGCCWSCPTASCTNTCARPAASSVGTRKVTAAARCPRASPAPTRLSATGSRLRSARLLTADSSSGRRRRTSSRAAPPPGSRARPPRGRLAAASFSAMRGVEGLLHLHRPAHVQEDLDEHDAPVRSMPR